MDVAFAPTARFVSHELQEKGEYENTLIATFPFFFAALPILDNISYQNTKL
jgi:hypothetical protein